MKWYVIYIQKCSHSSEKLLYFLSWPPPSVKSPTCPFIFTCCSVPLSGIKAELYPPAPPLPSPPPPAKNILSVSVSKMYWPIRGIPSWQPALKFICNPSTILKTMKFCSIFLKVRKHTMYMLPGVLCYLWPGKIAMLWYASPLPLITPVLCQSIFDSNDLNGRVLSRMWNQSGVHVCIFLTLSQNNLFQWSSGPPV